MEDLLVSVYRLMNIYNNKSRITHKYECGAVLYPAQVHTLEAIGSHDGITLTETASLLFVTRAAVSQCVKQLCTMGLVSREDMGTVGGAQGLHLTEMGRSVYSEHRTRHKDMINAVEDIWNSLSDDAKESVKKMIAITEKHILDLEE
ncbi:MAG: winged helix-turn-helix transcriptional regulator [Ruminiclostridium sp.]|nr:winged helix-turn-helix transcriptional regulator [Ruminiclostridium sp.]